MSGWGLIGIMFLAICAGPSPAFADERTDASGAANMPQRERDLIDILLDSRKQYKTSHSAAPARDARMGMQVRVISFMDQGQAAQDWVGTVASHGITPEGDAWISIEIADGVTVATWQNRRDDLDAATLFKRHSPLFTATQGAKIGRTVIFSGLIIKSVLSDDDEMVTRPQFIARFSSLKVAQ